MKMLMASVPTKRAVHVEVATSMRNPNFRNILCWICTVKAGAIPAIAAEVLVNHNYIIHRMPICSRAVMWSAAAL